MTQCCEKNKITQMTEQNQIKQDWTFVWDILLHLTFMASYDWGIQSDSNMWHQGLYIVQQHITRAKLWLRWKKENNKCFVSANRIFIVILSMRKWHEPIVVNSPASSWILVAGAEKHFVKRLLGIHLCIHETPLPIRMITHSFLGYRKVS